MKNAVLFAVLLCSFVLVESGVAEGKNRNTAVSAKSKRARVALAKSNKGRSEALLNRLAGIAQKLGVPPDNIELTRYAVKQPAHFARVVSHASTIDIPFFALVGAVKAAKGRDLPAIGSFTKAKCELPITIIESVFGKADSFIDDAKGKQDTNAVLSVAKEYAAQYAKEQSAAAKQRLIDELSQAIPYFGEIKTICSFAFDTTLSSERNIQKFVTEKPKLLYRAYNSFAEGNYGDGVAALMELGAAADIACEFLDKAVAGGAIGRLPVLGSLARGVCKNFVGKVIDGVKGVVIGGIGYAEDGVKAITGFGQDVGCAVYSIFGEGCSTAPPPDPFTQALESAKAWCAGRGGMKAFSSKVPGQDAGFTCVDTSACRKAAGGPISCITAQDKSAWEAQRKIRLLTDIAGQLPADIAAFVQKYGALCPLQDSECKNGIGLVASQGGAAIKAAASNDPTTVYLVIKFTPFRLAETTARQVIRDAEFRVLPQKWIADFNERYTDRCKGSAQCNSKLTFIRGLVTTAVKIEHSNRPEAPHSAMSRFYAEGEQLAVNYFKTDVQADRAEDAATRKKIIQKAMMDATGREANAIEIAGYDIQLKDGKTTAAGIYADAVAQMNKFPKTRTEMLHRGYQTTMGRPANPNDLQYWLPRKEGYKEFVQAARNYLYSPAGQIELRSTVIRALTKQTGSGGIRPAQLEAAIQKYRTQKAVFSEM